MNFFLHIGSLGGERKRDHSIIFVSYYFFFVLLLGITGDQNAPTDPSSAIVAGLAVVRNS